MPRATQPGARRRSVGFLLVEGQAGLIDGHAWSLEPGDPVPQTGRQRRGAGQRAFAEQQRDQRCGRAAGLVQPPNVASQRGRARALRNRSAWRPVAAALPSPAVAAVGTMAEPERRRLSGEAANGAQPREGHGVSRVRGRREQQDDAGSVPKRGGGGGTGRVARGAVRFVDHQHVPADVASRARTSGCFARSIETTVMPGVRNGLTPDGVAAISCAAARRGR